MVVSDRKALGRRVKEIREECGLTQADLAANIKAAGGKTSLSTIATLETATKDTGVSHLFSVASALGVSVACLFGPEGKRETTGNDEEAAAVQTAAREAILDVLIPATEGLLNRLDVLHHDLQILRERVGSLERAALAGRQVASASDRASERPKGHRTDR